jgi:hypothetical protein
MDRFFRSLCAVVGAGLALAACSPSQPERSLLGAADAAGVGSYPPGQTLSEPIVARKEASGFAVLALPAAAGRAGKLTEKQFGNGWRQSVSLDGAKIAGDWNDLTIEIQSQPAAAGETGELRLAKPTEEGIRKEILARFPATPMRIVTRPQRNALGPFGLAIGAGEGSLRCAFAWQWLDNLPAAARGEKANFFNSGEMAASIRMRLCRSGVSADDLALWYERLDVTDAKNVDRIVEALRNSPAGGAASPIVSRADSLEALVVADRRSVGVAKERSAPAPAPAPKPSARRAAPPRAPGEPRAREPLTSPDSPSADGRRYLAPAPGAAPQPPAAPAAPFSSAALPAQALRGPSAARAIVPPDAAATPRYLGPVR